MEHPSNKSTVSSRVEVAGLLAEDIKNREDFEYLLSIMNKQGASGITQPIDYQDALAYKNKKDSFVAETAPEGSVAELFDHVIFDFDGVLYDSTYFAYRATELMLEKKGREDISLPPSVAAVANTYSVPHTTYYKRYGITFDTPEKFLEFQKEYREVARQVNEEHHTPATLYPEVKVVLDTLREAKKQNPKLQIHIVSAGAGKYVRDVLEKYSLLADFDQIHTETQNKAITIKNISIQNGETDSKRTVMIGDLPSDIKDAQSEGVRAVGVARGEREEERLGMYLPDYLVRDLSGVLHLHSYSKQLREKDLPAT